MAKPVDLTGNKLGRLLVISRYGSNEEGRATWNCLCDCGNKKVALGKTLRSGDTRSCGCLHMESSKANLPDTAKPLGYERVSSTGYIEIKTSNGFRRKHIHLMEVKIGRSITKDEVVHHIDHDKLNNDIENLGLMTNGDHTVLHHTGAKRSAGTKLKISESQHKITYDEADEIREMYKTGIAQWKVARIFGLSQMTISRIVRNETYKKERNK